jgi:hypothetical protein
MPLGIAAGHAMRRGMCEAVIGGHRRLLGMSGGLTDISYLYRTLYSSCREVDGAPAQRV